MAQTNGGNRRGQRGGHERVGRDAVGGHRAAGVEAVPTHPQHAGADHTEHHAVRRHRFFAEADAFAQE